MNKKNFVKEYNSRRIAFSAMNSVILGALRNTLKKTDFYYDPTWEIKVLTLTEKGMTYGVKGYRINIERELVGWDVIEKYNPELFKDN